LNAAPIRNLHKKIRIIHNQQIQYTTIKKPPDEHNQTGGYYCIKSFCCREL